MSAYQWGVIRVFHGDHIHFLLLLLLLFFCFTTGSVERLKVIYADNQGSPLNDDITEVMQLCITVEGILRHLQKGVLL